MSGVLAALAVGIVTAPAPAAADLTFSVGAFEWVLRVDDSGGWNHVDRIEIRRAGEVQLAIEPVEGALFEDQPLGDLLLAPPGEDINGDGRPDVVLEVYSGGAHCCFTTYHFSLDPLDLVATLETRDSAVTLEDRDGDGGMELVFSDMSFAYWRTAFAFSPAEPVILSWSDGAWALDLDLQRRSPPTEAELQQMVKAARANGFDRDGTPNPNLWGPMMTLFYGGNIDSMLALFDAAWPDGREGRDAFLVAFAGQLAQSPYWRGLATLNGLSG